MYENKTGVSIAIGSFLASLVQYRAYKENREYQKEKDLRDFKLRQQQHELGKQQHNENFQQQAGLIASQQAHETEIEERRINNQFLVNSHPLRASESFLKLDKGIPDNSLRVFIVPPKHIAVTPTSSLNVTWNEININRLNKNICCFVQENYNSKMNMRPIFLYHSDILNPEGLRGANATRVLSHQEVNKPTLWIESNRISNDACTLEVSMWGGEYGYSHYNIIEIPNFNYALEKCNQSMGMSLIIKNSSNFKKTKKSVNDLSQNKNKIPEHLNDSAIDFLSIAYNMILAVIADLHYLKYGIAPILPKLISNKVFDLNDKCLKGATCHILEEYIEASKKLALGTNAILIWVGIGECQLSIDDVNRAKESFIKAMKPLNNQQTVAKSDTESSLISLVRRVAPKTDKNILARLSRGFENVGMNDLAKTLREVKADSLKHKSTSTLVDEQKDFKNIVDNVHSQYKK